MLRAEIRGAQYNVQTGVAVSWCMSERIGWHWFCLRQRALLGRWQQRRCTTVIGQMQHFARSRTLHEATRTSEYHMHLSVWPDGLVSSIVPMVRNWGCVNSFWFGFVVLCCHAYMYKHVYMLWASCPISLILMFGSGPIWFVRFSIWWLDWGQQVFFYVQMKKSCFHSLVLAQFCDSWEPQIGPNQTINLGQNPAVGNDYFPSCSSFIV